MKKLCCLILTVFISVFYVIAVSAEALEIKGGKTDREFCEERTLYYVYTDGTAAEITMENADVIKTAQDTLPSSTPLDAVTVLKDRTSGKEYRFVMLASNRSVGISDFDFNSEHSVLSVSGSTSSKEAVVQIVWLPEKTGDDGLSEFKSYSELTEDDIKENIIELRVLNSRFEFDYRIPDTAEIGDYVLIVNELGATAENAVYKTFYYVSPQAILDKLREFDKIQVLSDYEKFIRDNSKILNLDLTTYTEIKDRSVMFRLVKGKTYSGNDCAAEFKSDFNKGAALTLYNESTDEKKSEVLWRNKDILELAASGIEDKVSDRNAVLRMMSKSYDSLEKISGDFIKCTATQYINEAKGNELASRLSEVKGSIGLNAEVLSKLDKTKDLTAVYMSVRNKNFNDPEKLAEAITAALAENNALAGGNDRPSGSPSGSKGVLPAGGISGGVFEPEYEKPIVSGHEFTDIDTVLWAVEAINYLYDIEGISGKTENEFYPLDDVTREEFVKMLIAVFGIEITEENGVFSDVDEDKWYAKYVNTAYRNKIVSGKTDDIFGVGEKITREDMCVMLDNTAKVLGIDITVKDTYDNVFDFADKDSISQYASDSVARLYKKGIVSGVGDNMIAPKLNANRAMAAVIIYRLYIASL